jgi:fermentation-respiration switch protein FrsA (DUF1100 family)
VVSDGGPARLWTALAGWGIERGVPRWLAEAVAWPAVAMASLRLGINLFRYEPLRWVGAIAPRPILLIHGDLDPFLTLPELNRLVAAAGAPEVWRVADAGHRTVDERYPAEWRRRVIAFFDQHL